MIKKIVFVAMSLALGIASVRAQEVPDTVKVKDSEFLSAQEERQESSISHAKKFYVSLQGAPVLNYYENAFSYTENGKFKDLITIQGALSVGYDFSDIFGIRLQGAFGTGAGACNTRQTAPHGFYPYSFKQVNGFVDAMLNFAGLLGNKSAFRPIVYIGAGGAYTFGFKETLEHHPWQWDNHITKKNAVLGFRGGLLLEYCFRSGFGFLADFCGEAFADSYNGLMPSESDKSAVEGYPGFPFDLRAVASFGIVYHF